LPGCGGPGAGKSALLDYVMNSAGDAGTIRIEGLESEAEIGLAGLHGLLLFHPEHRSVLPPAQRRSLDANLGLSGPAEAAPFLPGLAILTLLNDLSRSRPLICLIDDAHWLDPESAQVLLDASRCTTAAFNRTSADRAGPAPPMRLMRPGG
jgi:hypothetical protein